MRVTINNSSDWSDAPLEIVSINTLEELLELMKKEGHSLIINPPRESDSDFHIEIYDDYRE